MHIFRVWLDVLIKLNKDFLLKFLTNLFFGFCKRLVYNRNRMPTVFSESSDGDLDELYYGEFPNEFKLGTSTVAHQVEGNLDENRKGISVWDELSHAHPKCIADRTSADEACDSYNRFEDDVLLLKCMNANSYSFSLNWSRLLPNGKLTSLNDHGVNYYNDLLNTLLENGIEPIVTLYYWDMPHSLMQKYAGGWMNENLIEVFVSYAKMCFTQFGDRVQHWISIAKPWAHSWKSYGNGAHPPNLYLGNSGALVANTNMLKAHSNVYKLYDNEFKTIQNGKLGISIELNDIGDVGIEQFRRVLYPLVHGEYPAYFNDTYPNCPQFSDEWSMLVKNSFDFLAVYYSPTSPSISTQSLQLNGSARQSSLSMQQLLRILKTEFGNPEVLVFNEGPALSPDQVMDTDRAQYFSQVSNDVLKAIHFDGCNVTGYFPGKLMDCWEWNHGFTITYGLYHVDFSQPSKKRSPRAAVAFMIKQLFKEKKFLPTLPF